MCIYFKERNNKHTFQVCLIWKAWKMKNITTLFFEALVYVHSYKTT